MATKQYMTSLDFLPYKKLSILGLDAKATGATLIGTTPNDGTRFYPVSVVFSVSSANTIAVAPALSIGQNSASYNDILAITTLTGVTAANNIIQTPLAATLISSIAANTGIYVKVTTGATATTCLIDIHLIGFYL